MRIVWLSHAQRDIDSIIRYHETSVNLDTAHRIARRIIHAATPLSESPYLGHPSEALDGVHELLVPKLPYLLPYRVVDDRIEILRVFHERQDRPSSWQDQSAS